MKKLLLLVFLIILKVPECFACSGFIVSDSDKVWVGNNEDWYNPNSVIWFVPENDLRFGAIYFGFDDGSYPFGGMNDQGLFFDMYALEKKQIAPSSGKPAAPGHLMLDVLSKSSTVEEALTMMGMYHISFLERLQLFLADSQGNAAIVEDNNTIIRKQGRFQLLTNFRQSEIHADQITCWRYKKALSMLPTTDIEVSALSKILNAVHQKDLTQYSNIHDLKNRMVYLYHMHHFDRVVVLDVQKELLKGERKIMMSSLFPDTIRKKRIRAQYQNSLINLFESRWFLALLVIGVLILLSGIMLWIVFFSIRLSGKPITEETLSKYGSKGLYIRLIPGTAGVLMILLLTISKMHPILFHSGLPCWCSGLTQVSPKNQISN